MENPEPSKFNILKENWEAKKSISSWMKYDMDYVRDHVTSRDHDVIGGHQYYGNLNFCLRLIVPSDPLCNKLPFGSVSTRATFRIPCISKSEYMVDKNVKRNPTYFPVLNDPHFVHCTSLEDEVSFMPTINWIPLSMVYSTKIMLLPMHKENFELEDKWKLNASPMVYKPELVKQCKPYFAANIKNEIDCVLNKKEYNPFSCSNQVKGKDVSFLCMIDMNPERLSCFSYNYYIATKFHNDSHNDYQL